MPVQELTDLANWLKKNVLDLSEDDGDLEIQTFEYEEIDGDEPDTTVVFYDDVEPDEINAKDRDVGQDLLAYIVGINDM
jgi:hypothetical protein